jgi:hypothetical protein
VSRPQRRKPVQKPSEASEHPGHVQGTGNLLAAIIAARVFEIERMKLGGADKNLIAMKEKTLAALIAKSKSSQTL